MIEQVEFEDWVPFPLARAFLFFANPENLPRIMPPGSGTRIDRLNLIAPASLTSEVADPNSQSLAGVGSEIVISFRMLTPLPVRVRWIARVTEFEWNRHLVDIQAMGPFKSWNHRHEFVAEMRDGTAGTLMLDQIEYSIGFGVLGDVAQKLFVSRQLRDTFAGRQKALPGLLCDL